MMILKTVVIVLLVFLVGFRCAKLNELKRWNEALHSLDVSNSGYDFSEGVLWAFHMVIEKEDTRHEPET